MISTRALGALRVAATLTHSVPQLRARVRCGDTVVLDIRSTDADADANRSDCLADGRRTITPCAFRSSVAHAYQRHTQGERLAFLDFAADDEPAVDIATPSSGSARPGGLYRVPLAGRWLWAVATTLPSDIAFETGRDIVDAAGPLTAVHALGLRPDLATDVTIAYAETSASIGSVPEQVVIDLLESLLARWTVHELLSCGSAERGSSRDRPGR